MPKIDRLLEQPAEYMWGGPNPHLRIVHCPQEWEEFSSVQLMYLARKLSEIETSPFMIEAQPTDGALREMNRVLKWGTAIQESGHLVMVINEKMDN